MTIVQRIPASKPGDFLCELRSGTQIVQRCITSSASEARQLFKSGAILWVARHGGWIRKS